jgi:UDP-N-acetylmuramoyl-tripeptide--D-alanyl-D-alanine ligase
MLIKNILLAFQLENYKNTRFLKFIYTHFPFWFYGSERQNLVWTKKALFILALTLFLFLGDCMSGIFMILSFWAQKIFIIPFLLVEIFLLPIYFVVANFLSFPLDTYLKNKIIAKAKEKMKTFKNLTVIGITGSYGKTSTKDMIYTLLKEKFKVLTTEGNKNTPLWVSEVILEKLDESIEIFIVEMGAFIPWDIKALCDIVNPKIGILTGITLQHLERFKNLENIIKTKFELIQSLPTDGLALIDTTSDGVKQGLEKYQFSMNTKNIKTISASSSFQYLDNLEWISFELDGNTYQTKLIAKHSLQTIQIAYEVAKYFWLSLEEIKAGIEKIDYTKHRMELIRNTKNGVNIIDDSYNGNIEWVKSIIDLLKNTNTAGKKLIIAEGIVELWEKLEEVNNQFGQDLSEVVDIVLLTKWPTWEAIYRWLKEKWFDEKNIKIYPHSLDIHNDLKNILQFWDIIVFQNDLPDNYL